MNCYVCTVVTDLGTPRTGGEREALFSGPRSKLTISGEIKSFDFYPAERKPGKADFS
jgi:hypothetical protein